MRTSKTSLFLMELIISILFFAISSAVCIQLFTKSHLLDEKTKMENMAIVKCENYCEMYVGLIEDSTVDSERIKLIAEMVSGTVSNDSTVTVYYDKSWNPCPSSEAYYYSSFEDYGYDESTGLFSGLASVYTVDSTPIYHLSVDWGQAFFN